MLNFDSVSELRISGLARSTYQMAWLVYVSAVWFSRQNSSAPSSLMKTAYLSWSSLCLQRSLSMRC